MYILSKAQWMKGYILSKAKWMKMIDKLVAQDLCSCTCTYTDLLIICDPIINITLVPKHFELFVLTYMCISYINTYA